MFRAVVPTGATAGMEGMSSLWWTLQRRRSIRWRSERRFVRNMEGGGGGRKATDSAGKTGGGGGGGEGNRPAGAPGEAGAAIRRTRAGGRARSDPSRAPAAGGGGPG